MVGVPDPFEPTPEELVRVLALDGPAGSGKSTVARLAAQALGWRFVDTGATYRAVTLAVLRAGVSPADTQRVVDIARKASIVLDTEGGGPAVVLDGEDVSAEVRGPEVTATVSAVSAIPAVRQVLIGLQRRLMGTQGAVVEGRDIATVVAPRAGVKVYLDASPEVRAQRRAAELAPADVTLAPDDSEVVAVSVATPLLGHREVQEALTHRDAVDSQTNKLIASDGAVHLDTSDLSLEEVVAFIVAQVEDAGLTAGVDRPLGQRARDTAATASQERQA